MENDYPIVTSVTIGLGEPIAFLRLVRKKVRATSLVDTSVLR
jgi:hypothetical protein